MTFWAPFLITGCVGIQLVLKGAIVLQRQLYGPYRFFDKSGQCQFKNLDHIIVNVVPLLYGRGPYSVSKSGDPPFGILGHG